MQLLPSVYATFAGPIDQSALNRLFFNLNAATQRGVVEAHLLFQSGGGIVGDGISLYNYFRTLPLDLHVYNTGTVGSIAVLPFLAAPHRYASAHANFVIHKTRYGTQAPTDAIGHRALAHSAELEDARSEAILHNHTKIPASHWSIHAAARDVIFTAQEAVQFGIADQIREFQVPSGNQVFHI
jgi:ATP-dependent Clp protease protease subunit